MLDFAIDVFLVSFCVTWVVFMCWFMVWLWAYMIGSYLEFRVETHARMQERFAMTTNRGKYEYHARQLKKYVRYLNKAQRFIDTI